MENESKQSSVLEVFLKYTALFYLIIIIDGYISDICFYSIFGINVGEYFSIEDYVNGIFTNMKFLLFGVILYIISFKFFNKVSIYDFLASPKKWLKDYYDLYDVYRSPTMLIGSIVTSIISLSVLLLIFRTSKDIRLLGTIIGMASFFLTIITYSLLIYLVKNKKIKLRRSSLFTITFFILIVLTKLSMSVSSGIVMYHSETNYQKISFYFDNGKTVVTSDSTLYLGSCKDYIFLFDKIKQKALIYSKSSVNLVEKSKLPFSNKTILYK